MLDDHYWNDDSFRVAEVGIGYNAGATQVNFALGKARSKQDLIHDGYIDIDSEYIFIEGIIPLQQKGLYAIITSYYHRGNADIERAYLNSGNRDYSSATTDLDTFGVKLRFEWQDAIIKDSTKISPYTDLSYRDNNFDGYTEKKGAFPARFDSRDEKITELRAGINTSTLLNSKINLLGNAEFTHRFGYKSARASGQLINTMAFDISGQKYDNNWVKAGLGFEGKLGEGTGSLMLNVSREGGSNTSWLTAFYIINF